MRVEGVRSKPGIRSIWDGLTYVGRNRIVAGAMLSDLSATVLAMPFAILPALNSLRFGGSPSTLGLLNAAPAVGGVLAMSLSGPVGRSVRKGVWLLVAGALWGAALTCLGLTGRLWVALAVLAVAGAADATAVVLRGAIVQSSIPDEFRGRTTSIDFVVGAGGPHLGNFAAVSWPPPPHRRSARSPAVCRASWPSHSSHSVFPPCAVSDRRPRQRRPVGTVARRVCRSAIRHDRRPPAAPTVNEPDQSMEVLVHDGCTHVRPAPRHDRASGMVKILVGNDFDEVLRTRPASGWWNQRVTWFAEDGDLVILPARPEESFLRYVTGMTGTRRSSLRVLVPPAEEGRPDTLSGSCLVDEEFLGQIRSALAGRPVTGIVPLWPSASIARLARALGVPEALAGREFAEQGGGALLNSKTAFRAIAAGVGVGLPCGRVCADRDGTVDAVLELVGAGHIAMLKKDYMSGGAGNEIVSPVPGVSPVGAKNVVVAADEAAVVRYVEDRWDWLTDGGRHQFVVERYHPGSVACFAEFLITDDGIEFGAHGEMLSEPVTTKQIIPPPAFSGQVLDDLTDQGRRLCEPLRAMGYRGGSARTRSSPRTANCSSPSTTDASRGPPTSTASSGRRSWAVTS